MPGIDRPTMQVRHIYISPAHIYVGRYGKNPGTEAMQEVESVECVAGRGLRGDRYFDHKQDYKGQVTFFSMAIHAWLCAELGEVDRSPAVYRRNVMVSGVDLNTLIGQEFEVQGMRFLGTEEAKPCLWMNTAFGPGAEESLRGNGGLRARILTDGMLRRDIPTTPA